MAQPKLLILGGTSDSAVLAHALTRRFGDRVTVISSLSGATEIAAEIPGQVRRGGFGGIDGLIDYLRREAISFVIDSTHPFAATISSHSREACTRLGLPRLTLLRPGWPRLAGEHRIMVPDMATGAAKLAEIGVRRVFVTTGAKDLAALAGAPQAWFLIRLIEPLVESLPIPSYALMFARGPFTSAGEHKLMIEHEIDALMTKDSGGHATYGKIIAARDLGLPVVTLERPATSATEDVDTIEAALDWVETRL